MDKLMKCHFYIITIILIFIIIIIIIFVTTSNRLAAVLASRRRQRSSKRECVVRHIQEQSGVSGCTLAEPFCALWGNFHDASSRATVSWMTLGQYGADNYWLTTDFAPKHRLNTSRRP